MYIYNNKSIYLSKYHSMKSASYFFGTINKNDGTELPQDLQTLHDFRKIYMI